ncbi:hypothetical protein J1N35_023292 [Gossypium stocksii]|uniref:Uncharacterized protein n=1 Tax=Gossypium stocksii TaxID=47602 RepID=A0A9D3VIG5_9ROSI|nr:hypothetical protein J1N35_023292 [Gossypium stocksii]
MQPRENFKILGLHALVDPHAQISIARVAHTALPKPTRQCKPTRPIWPSPSSPHSYTYTHTPVFCT